MRAVQYRSWQGSMCFYRSCEQPFVLSFFVLRTAFVGLAWFLFLFMGPNSTRHEQRLAFIFLVVFGDVGFYFLIARGKLSFFLWGWPAPALRFRGRGRVAVIVVSVVLVTTVVVAIVMDVVAQAEI